MNQELTNKQEDFLLEESREKAHEIDDGAFEEFINSSFYELTREFCCEDFNDEFRDFAKTKFNEINE